MSHIPHALRTAGLALLLSASALHAQHGLRPYLLGRPNVHLSGGGIGVVPTIPNEGLRMGDPQTEGSSFEGMVRVKGPWMLGLGFSTYQAIGELWHTDSVITSTYFDWLAALLGGDPYGTESLTWGDAMYIDRRCDTYELLGAYELDKAQHRHYTHFTGRISTGPCAQFLQERHSYELNVLQGYRPHPDNGQEVHAMGWAWVIRLRCDLHFTRLLSVFAEVQAVQALGALHIESTSFTQDGETFTAPARTVDPTGSAVHGGVALHF